MISAIAWLPLGVAAEDPKHVRGPATVEDLVEICPGIAAEGGFVQIRQVAGDSASGEAAAMAGQEGTAGRSGSP